MNNDDMIQKLKKTGQATSFEDLQGLDFDFEKVLKDRGALIKPGSDLEAACLSVISILGKQRREIARDPREDIRHEMTRVLGIWIFLQKIVRLKDSPDFAQLVPHLHLLNEGTVGQNTPILVCEDATNKIFELLFALCMLDIGTNVVLDPPDRSKGDNHAAKPTAPRRYADAVPSTRGQSVRGSSGSSGLF